MAKITSLKELFTKEFLVDILSTASYGSFWFDCSVHKDTPDDVYKKAKKENECREEIWADCLLGGACLNICDVEECADNDTDEGEHKVGLNDIVKGFEIVMLNYPQMYANIREENYDLYDADAVIQCAVFGELVYG